MKRIATLFLLAAIPSFLPACGDDSGVGGDGSGGNATAANLVGAKGITITDLAIYQTLKRPLALDGSSNGVPLVAGKDAAIRIFYALDGNYDGKAVTVRLDIDGGDPIEVKGTLSIPASTEEDVNSTINLFVPGARIGATMTYSVAVLQEGEAGDDNAAAHWPPSGKQAIPVEGPVNTMRVTLAPFQYNTDGSGRVPDTTPASVEKYRNRLKQLYPVSDVVVTVREATPWSQPIYADGTGWYEVGMRVATMRGQDGASDDVYYYGVFNPEDSFNQYCAAGCLLGVTLLNNDPPDVGIVGLRLALGIGYDPYAYDTFTHELGHAHGREHAPCGPPGNPPANVDPAFPYPDASLGVWGMDPATMTLYPPTGFTDLMGYCDPAWISDYTYKALLNRAKNVNLPDWHQPTGRDANLAKQKVALVAIDGHGGGSWGGFSLSPSRGGGRVIATTLIDEYGRRTPASAHFYPSDHLPGGMAVINVADDRVSQVELEIDNVRHLIHSAP